MLNAAALQTGIEPDKDPPRTAVGVAVPFTCKQRWFDVQTARVTKQWNLRTLTGWQASRGNGPARSVGESMLSLRRYDHCDLPISTAATTALVHPQIGTTIGS